MAVRTTSTRTSRRRCRRSGAAAPVGGEFRGHWSAVAARSLTRASGASDPVRPTFPQAPAGGGAYAVGMRTHARRAILLALVWLPAAAAAQQVFKCVAGDEVAYQSAPCAAGQATEKAWEHGTYAPPDESYLQRIRQWRRPAATGTRNSAMPRVPRDRTPRDVGPEQPRGASRQSDAATQPRRSATGSSTNSARGGRSRTCDGKTKRWRRRANPREAANPVEQYDLVCRWMTLP